MSGWFSCRFASSVPVYPGEYRGYYFWELRYTYGMFNKLRRTASKPEREIFAEPDTTGEAIQPGLSRPEPGDNWLVTSQARPRQVPARLANWFSRQHLIGIGAFIVLAAIVWLMFIGPGRPALEGALARLADAAPTATYTPQPTTPEPAAAVTKTPTATVPRPTATRRPVTPTPISTLAAAATGGPSETSTFVPSPTFDSSGCVDATTITSANVGQTLCVRGIVLYIQPQTTGFIVVFSDAQSAFYWITYDVVWTQDKTGQCLQTTGEIRQLGDRPVLVFNYGNMPQLCP